MAFNGNLKRYYKNVTQTMPSAGGSTASGKTLIGAAYDLADLHRKTFYVFNWGPSVNTVGILEYSPDNEKWGTYDGTTFQNIGSGVLVKLDMENSIRFFKFSGNISSVVSTLSIWWTF